MKWLFVLCLLFLTEPSFSKTKKRKKSKKPRIVDIDFDDELQIKGRLEGPSIFSLFQKKDLNYGKLIKPRKDFLPEMRMTFEDMK